MVNNIFVNLPVKDLQQSIAFFTSLGFTFNPQFTDATATCMIIGPNIYAMLLTERKFKSFSPGEICDTTKSNEVLVCLGVDTRERVDELVTKALAAGGSTYKQPVDYGFMYSHCFKDLDGHAWEIIHMAQSS